MIGIIGGTGLYAMQELTATRTHTLATPYGAPSAPFTIGTLRGREVAFLARHGLEHRLLPGEINFRANIWALKSLGVRTVIGVSAVGSLRQEIHPGDLALPSQYLDFTRGTRAASFFGGGLVAHVSSAQPTCRATAALIARVARSQGVTLHEDKTYACVEGPRLGTRAESLFLRTAGADLVGMTNVPEAFLALEAQLGYCTIAVVTDYDCWLEDPTQHAAADQILALFRGSLGRVQQLIAATVGEYREDEARPCRNALRGALVTPRERMTPQQRALVDFLQG
ncbi:MAG: S-methyl-5'-thioadenosine phosphorylase [Gammaproteobacteria bacterium]|nr:MAG: S-methyl-5'-thioadenosine phosphorylase [Gammaproteobacteria bacterium]